MTRIVAMHGIVRECNPALFVHRNMDDWDRFERHLKERSAPYVSVDDARAGKGDALTIDDSTHAAADAARLARTLGHEVTFFINPWNIVENTTYIPALLNVLMDGITAHEFNLEGRLISVQSAEEKKLFRSRFKEFLNAILSLEEQERVIRARAKNNSLSLTVPEHLQTVSVAELEVLKKEGVTIQNHGWKHLHHDVLSSEEKVINVEEGRQWLQDTLGIEAVDFAIPFGVENRLSFPPTKGVWYLLDSTRPTGVVGDRLFNRSILAL